mmetsp:Transcript_28148/g.80919  ORF Transcript_28148/g.80919 Transcript_28148/m.80919 type:complete len:348 (-) Transcript_28148:66-1109(-)
MSTADGAAPVGKAQWFPCPSCDFVVTGLVVGTGPKHTQEMSQTHCCRSCAAGRGHDTFWCCGFPATALRQVELSTGERAHCVVQEPAWAEAQVPVPAVLWLHGALTYIWPETIYKDVRKFLDTNAAARRVLVVAPLATCGEPLAVVSERRTKENRYGVEAPYVDSFDGDKTWDCFLQVCRALGPEKVDFRRLSVTGLSMGAQAAWDIALSHGSCIAALAPIAGCCAWPRGAWDNIEKISDQLRGLPIRAFAIEEDTRSYAWRDFVWLSQVEGGSARPEEVVTPCAGGTMQAHTYAWSDGLELTLVRGHRDGHNCWDLVYQEEEVFRLFSWMSGLRRAEGATLATAAA